MDFLAESVIWKSFPCHGFIIVSVHLRGNTLAINHKNVFENKIFETTATVLGSNVLGANIYMTSIVKFIKKWEISFFVYVGYDDVI